MKQPIVRDGQRVAREITLIRAALKTQGYRTRKQPRKVVWVVQVESGQSYHLIFQPALVSTWVLHPIEQNSTYQHLSNVIQGALAPHSTLTEASR